MLVSRRAVRWADQSRQIFPNRLGLGPEVNCFHAGMSEAILSGSDRMSAPELNCGRIAEVPGQRCAGSLRSIAHAAGPVLSQVP